MAKKNDKWIKRWAIESFTDPDQKYTVALDRDSNYGCSCKAWIFGHKRGRPICKHIHLVVGMTDRERASVLVRQYSHLAADALCPTEWKVFLIEDKSGHKHVAMTRNFGDRE